MFAVEEKELVRVLSEMRTNLKKMEYESNGILK